MLSVLVGFRFSDRDLRLVSHFSGMGILLFAFQKLKAGTEVTHLVSPLKSQVWKCVSFLMIHFDYPKLLTFHFKMNVKLRNLVSLKIK